MFDDPLPTVQTIISQVTSAVTSLGDSSTPYVTKMLLENIALLPRNPDDKIKVAMHMWSLISSLPSQKMSTDFMSIAKGMIISTGHKILGLDIVAPQKLRILQALEIACEKALKSAMPGHVLKAELYANLGYFYTEHARLLSDKQIALEYYVKAQNEYVHFSDMREQYTWEPRDFEYLSPGKYMKLDNKHVPLDQWVSTQMKYVASKLPSVTEASTATLPPIDAEIQASLASKIYLIPIDDAASDKFTDEPHKMFDRLNSAYEVLGSDSEDE